MLMLRINELQNGSFALEGNTLDMETGKMEKAEWELLLHAWCVHWLRETAFNRYGEWLFVRDRNGNLMPEFC